MGIDRPVVSRRRLAAGTAATLIALLAGCGSSSEPVDGGSPAARSGWTTLGTRQQAATPAREAAQAVPAPLPWSDYDPPAAYDDVVTANNQFITMDDGIRLAASVTLPAADGAPVQQALPVILTLTGYNKDFGAFVPVLGGANRYLVEHGYVHVNVDVRGTGRSDGQWNAFDAREQQDYRQVVDWVVAQPWCDGNVGMYGASFLGITSLLTAAKDHPAVKAVFPIVPMSDAYRDVVLVGGQGSFGFLTGWLGFVTAASVVNPSLYQSLGQALPAMLEHATSALTTFQVPTLLRGLLGDPQTIYDTDFWAVRSPVEQVDNIRVPVFIVGGLHDIFQRGEPRLYEQLKDHTTTKLLLGPWDHFEAALGVGLPADGVPALNHLALRWFDRWLRGERNGAENLPAVTQWVWGHEHFVTAPDWPHPEAHAERLYLHGDHSLSARTPAADAEPRTLPQQPLNGLCSQSSDQVTLGLLGLVPLPCFENDNLAQTLEASYDTAPMSEDWYINGPIQADLWISTTAMNTGLVVRVSDVGPDGRATALTSGIQTASLRQIEPTKSRYLDGQMIQPWHPFTQASVQAVGSGNRVPVAVEVFPTSALIRRGHRLRISVGSSNFPFGTQPLPDLLQSFVGLLRIHSDAEHPSSVVLPVVPAAVIN